MHFSKLTLAITAAFAGLSQAAVLDLAKRNVDLKVTLAAVENAVFKATVTNVGTSDLNLLAYGTLFDTAPVEKLNVASGASKIQFKGILRSVQRSGLTSEAFVPLAAGATYTTTINAAEVHDLSTGSYSFTAEGAIPFAEAGSTVLTGEAIYFKSNTLTSAVDGEVAKLVKKAIDASLVDRSVVQTGCTTAQKSATTVALANCRALALQATTTATSGSATKFNEYFKTTAAATRSVVANRLTAVAAECGSATSGATKYYCTDVYGYCSSNVLAYTLPSTNVVVNCPLYYSALPSITRTCHAQDQATTTLHEMTHAPRVYSPGTQDNGYGYAAATALTSAKAVLNADSYALYANAIYVSC